jgi:hypothetical protein
VPRKDEDGRRRGGGFEVRERERRRTGTSLPHRRFVLLLSNHPYECHR